MSLTLNKESHATEILIQWWQGLENNKGTRAELRRCTSPDKVMFQPAFQRLCQRLKPEPQEQRQLASVVGLLAHVRHTTGQKLAYQMAGNPPVVSELRFRRLLQRDRTDLYGAMIRILRMLDHRANLPDLISSVFYWGDKVRKDWAFYYFPNTPEKAAG
ncbi:type I-E CRISPR-associated protein Cse2/CasB [endosymbiont of Ridgeia piscesae]|jgi:CRISPR system Cascade subunit CasB|uniref:CRISPR-associated protein, Cse2 family n=1 Tax=endosymbiont of Ridgeia piscesae TaxID=54398 RepID=A0A0T5YUN1_9GAMM|nr:type I-E CRISPR-associated protein Cse2/CasB [endosymbiont of Ridgeia piscesae]KRT54280.1 CRISPR-associated protein, Cse2 family [endosymbiont of Ridgeia piscesae]KRT59757.1 CRISPR-associated protein, Cse2 family [endosymbiont of Ridgeia piscesae]